MIITSIAFFAALVVQQSLALPFRICAGLPLTFVLRVTAPVVSVLCCLFLMVNSGEPCYGRDLSRFDSMDDFLQACSASKRKNIKRNLKKAQDTLRTKGIQASYHLAGTWRCTREIRTLLWDQCKGHDGFTCGSPAIVTGNRPVPPAFVYFVEMVFFAAFPNDIQILRDREGRLISINTRTHIRNMYCNPTYACRHEHAKDGIYSYSNRHSLTESFRVQASVVNVMPSMRSAKGSLGLRPLHMGAIAAAGLSFACKAPRSPKVEEDR